MEFDLTTIFAACTLLAILYVGVQLWQQRKQTPITPDAILAAAGQIPNRAKQFFDTALIVAHYIEQISKPDRPGDPPKLTNEQKKAQAMALVKEQHAKDERPPDMREINIAVEGAVHAVKNSGQTAPAISPFVPAPIAETKVTEPVATRDELDAFLAQGGDIQPPPSGVGIG